MFRNFALEWAVHFLTEKRSKSYKWYGAASIAGEKCAERQEKPYKDRLVLALERFGA